MAQISIPGLGNSVYTAGEAEKRGRGGGEEYGWIVFLGTDTEMKG